MTRLSIIWVIQLTSTNIISVTACEKHDLNRINQDNAKQINCATIHT